MIVVIASPSLMPGPEGPLAAGLGARIALAAAAAGAEVQLVGKVGDDPPGDALLLVLAAAGVGHVAMLRDAARPTPELAAARPGEDGEGDRDGADILDAAGLLDEPEAAATGADDRRPAPVPTLEAADLELGLRYLVDYRVVVAAEPLDPAAAAAVAEAAGFVGAQIVALLPPGSVAPDAFAGSTVLEAPSEDPDDDLARLVAAYAVALDAGEEPGSAFRRATATIGWEAAGT